jgi:hypothetical protein
MNTFQIIMGIFLFLAAILEGEYHDTESTVSSILKVIIYACVGAAAALRVWQNAPANYEFIITMAGMCYMVWPAVAHRIYKGFNRRST